MSTRGEGTGGGKVRMETSIVSAVCIGRNCLLGNGKKIAKFLMRTFTCRSTFLYDLTQGELTCGRLKGVDVDESGG